MANLNAGTPRRFINGGTLLWGTATGTLDTILNVREGTLRVSDPGRSAIPYMDGSELSAKAIEGDQRPITVSFEGRVTIGGLTGASEISKLLAQGFATGLATLKILRIRIPDARGGATGQQLTLLKCFVDGYEYQSAGQGEDGDRLTFNITDLESGVSWTTY